VRRPGPARHRRALGDRGSGRARPSPQPLPLRSNASARPPIEHLRQGNDRTRPLLRYGGAVTVGIGRRSDLSLCAWLSANAADGLMPGSCNPLCHAAEQSLCCGASCRARPSRRPRSARNAFRITPRRGTPMPLPNDDGRPTCCVVPFLCVTSRWYRRGTRGRCRYLLPPSGNGLVPGRRTPPPSASPVRSRRV